MGFFSVDTPVFDASEKLVVSYGPRRMIDNGSTVTVAETPEQAEFYGVYRHDPNNGEATCMFDVCTREDAVVAAALLVKYETIRKIVAEDI